MAPEERFVQDGRFSADGLCLADILAVHPTPFYLYAASVIREKYRRLKQHFPAFDVCYSLKANPNAEVVRVLAALGAGAEVSSRGELRTALSAGISPGNIVFVGPAKTTSDIEAAIDAGVHALVVDSAGELEQVENAARQRGRPVRVLLRINTMEQPAAQEKMVGGPSKFGFDEETVVRDAGSVKLNQVEVAGIQVYSASQSLDSGFITNHIEYVLSLAERLSRRLGLRLTCIDFGGGFGVPYNEADRELDLAAIAQATDRLLGRRKRSISDCRLVFESGRYLVAESGVFATQVVRVKESRGRLLAITDGGMNSFSRPVFMRISHPVRLLNRIAEPAATEVDVCGPICTPLDCIGRAVRLPRPEPGDVVGFLNAGAYGYTMSLLDFMSLGRPAELMADSGQLRVIREPVGRM
jgi:diaminopimelate decarboxylase